MKSLKVFKLQRIERAITKRERREELALREARIKAALALPFAEALPLFREACNVDPSFVFRDDITRWCAQHAKEILAFHEERKKG
jgi:hypothetical protein